jgi:hypothetical protein
MLQFTDTALGDVMCNAMYHAPECKCGFGGEGHLGGRSGGRLVRRTITHRSLAEIAKEEGVSIVVPVKCKFCSKDPVFLFASYCGGFTVFESLGLPWPKHECPARWSTALATDAYLGQTFDTVSIPRPTTPEDMLNAYYAEHRKEFEDWLRNSSQIDKAEKHGNSARRRLKYNALQSCPAELVPILDLFHDQSVEIRREIQMLTPVIKLVKAVARHKAKRYCDERQDVNPFLPIDMSGRQYVNWVTSYILNDEQLPEFAPRESDFEKGEHNERIHALLQHILARKGLID